MHVSDLFFGTSGKMFASAGIIVILVMMFIVSIRLYWSRRKKAYFSMTISLVIVIAQNLLLVALNRTVGPHTAFWVQVLQTIAFIIINMGIYQLYNPSRPRVLAFFYTLLSITLLLAAARTYFVAGIAPDSLQSLQFYNFWIDAYLLLLIFLGYYLVSPKIGQHIKYQFALTLFLLIQISYMLNSYILKEAQPTLSLLENFLPIVYYMTLFLILFERVVELLHAVYASSITDGLTGLFTRHYLLNRLNQLLAHRENVSVIFGDIDNFKKLNDTRGHVAGDKLLKQVARIMQEESDGIGIAGRYGGEELVVVVNDSSLRVENLAERIRSRVEAETGVTVSLGYSKCKKGATANELIMQADQAMYASKKSGKNKVTGYRQPAEHP